MKDNSINRRKVVDTCKCSELHKWKIISEWYTRSFMKDYDRYGHPEDRFGERVYYQEAEFECEHCGLKKILTKDE